MRDPVKTIADALDIGASSLTDGETFFVEGYANPGDGGGGWLRYDASSTATVDGGLVFNADNTDPPPAAGRLLRNTEPFSDGHLNARWFGALPTPAGVDAKDVTTNLQNAIDALPEKGGVIYLPGDANPYRATASGAYALQVLNGGVYLVGDGSGHGGGGTTAGKPSVLQFTADIGIRFNSGSTTQVRGGGLRGLFLQGDGAGIAVQMNQNCSHMDHHDVVLRQFAKGWELLKSCLKQSWRACGVQDVTDVGWDLMDTCHNCLIDGAFTSSLNTATGSTAGIRVGATQHCSQFTVVNSSFDHWGVAHHIDIVEARAVRIEGVYAEFKGTPGDPRTPNTDEKALIRIGSLDSQTTPQVAGFVISGCYLLGNTLSSSSTQPAIELNSHTGGSIIGNDIRGFTPNNSGRAVEDNDTISARAGTTWIGVNAFDGTISDELYHPTGAGLVAQLDQLVSADAPIEVSEVSLRETDSNAFAVRVLAGASGGRLDIYRGGAQHHSLTGFADTTFNVDQSVRNTIIYGSGGTLLFCDSTNDRVGIATASPGYTLDVDGTFNVTSGNALHVGGQKVVGAQGAAIGKLTVAAAPGSGTLPSVDGAVTVNATSPTNAELLEYCMELEAKLSAIIDRLGDTSGHGLTAD